MRGWPILAAMKTLLTLLAMSALPAFAQTAGEAASFAAYYKEARPQVVAAPPVYKQGKGGALSATVDEAPRRGKGALCRSVRTSFSYDPKARRWSQAGPDTRLAWLSAGSCAMPEKAVALHQRVPDAELLPLLEQHGVLLLNARLLMAGNTSCAPMRSYRLKLVGVDVSAPPNGSEELYALQFESDRDTWARVWVRKGSSGLDAWNVACGA
jgi:hypothetical protein